MPNWDKTVEQLHSEVSDLENLLNELKTKTLSNQEREKKENELKDRAEKLQWQIDGLTEQEWIDAKLVAEKERAETILKNCNDTVKLKSSIVDWSKTDKKDESSKSESTETTQTSAQSETQNPSTTEEEKWFFWKIWDGLSNMWDDVTSTEKWKEQPWKNLLYVGWTLVTWYAAYKWVKALWNWAFWDDEEWESDEEESETKSKKKKKKKKSNWESSWRKKFLIGAWITTWTVIWWVEVYKHRNRISSRSLVRAQSEEKGGDPA